MNHSQDEIQGELGRGREGPTWLRRGVWLAIVMYSTRLAGAVRMTPPTLWPQITRVWPHEGPGVALEFEFTTLKYLSVPFLHLFTSLGRSQNAHHLPPQPHPTSSRHGLWSHAGVRLWSDWDWLFGVLLELVAVSCRLQGLCLKWASTAEKKNSMRWCSDAYPSKPGVSNMLLSS